jgi:hypothetical protein
MNTRKASLMKRINLVVIASALPLLVLIIGVSTVAAKGENESIPQGSTIHLSEESIHLGGTVMVTAVFTDPDLLDGYTAVIDWGDGTVEEGWWVTPKCPSITGEHLYSEPGHYGVVVIVIYPDGSQTSSSAALYVMTAQETIDELIEHVDSLVFDTALTPDQGQSLVDLLETAQAALDEEDTEETVEALQAYPDELTGYIDAELVSKEYPSIGIAGDLANVLLPAPDMW